MGHIEFSLPLGLHAVEEQWASFHAVLFPPDLWLQATSF